MAMSYYISRQLYWPDGESVVEVAGGGLDYANPDMLCSGKEYKKLGCDAEHTNPLEAVKAAIAIRDLWNKYKLPDDQARVETGYTSGATMPFGNYPTDEELTQWATERWEKLPKCDKCGEAIIELFMHVEFPEEFGFCSEYCVEQWHYQNWESEEV